MIVNVEQLEPYLEQDADLIPLNVWNKQTTNKNGKVVKRGKTPLNENWTTSPKDTDQAVALLKKSYNIGFRIGERDLVIDVDPRNYIDGVNSLDKLHKFLQMDKETLFDICPTVLTGGGGYHFYTIIPSGVNLKETIEDFPGIEFKTKGRQVVTAGSKHPNGKYYEWDEFAPDFKNKVCLEDLIDLLQYETPTNQPDAGELNGEQLYRLLEQIPIEDYNNNDNWFPILCAAHHGTNGDGLEEFLDWSLSDLEFCDDEHMIRCRWASLGEKSTNTTIATLYKEVLVHGGNTAVIKASEDFEGLGDSADDLDDFDDFDDIVTEQEIKSSYSDGLALRLANELSCVAKEEEIVKTIRAALQSGTIEKVSALNIIQKTMSWSKGQLTEIIKNIEDKIADDLGRILAEKTYELKFHKKKGLVMNTNGQFWKYNDKYWTAATPQFVGLMITNVLDNMRQKIEVKVNEDVLVSQSLRILGRLSATDHDIMRLRERPHPVVNCDNGELWIKKDGSTVLKKHRPGSYLLQILKVDYSPGATCPMFDKAIREIFERYDDCEEMVRHLEEWMGYVLHPDKRPAKWWLFKGPGGDGKTTLLKILSAILGDAVLPESIESFKRGTGGDNHASSNAVGKLLIYDDDLNRNTVLPDGTLKKLSEDGELTANPKGVQAFKFRKICTVTMLSNGYPKTKDLTKGFRRRVMVIPFNRSFHEDGEDLDLADRIIKKELAGVLNRALQGLQRLRARGEFDEPNSCILAKEILINESNSVALFLNERCERTKDKSDTVGLSNIYDAYMSWCGSNGIQRTEMKQQVRSIMEDMDILYGKIGGNVAGFRGLKLIKLLIDDFDDLEDFEDEL